MRGSDAARGRGGGEGGGGLRARQPWAGAAATDHADDAHRHRGPCAAHGRQVVDHGAAAHAPHGRAALALDLQRRPRILVPAVGRRLRRPVAGGGPADAHAAAALLAAAAAAHRLRPPRRVVPRRATDAGATHLESAARSARTTGACAGPEALQTWGAAAALLHRHRYHVHAACRAGGAAQEPKARLAAAAAAAVGGQREAAAQPAPRRRQVVGRWHLRSAQAAGRVVALGPSEPGDL